MKSTPSKSMSCARSTASRRRTSRPRLARQAPGDYASAGILAFVVISKHKDHISCIGKKIGLFIAIPLAASPLRRKRPLGLLLNAAGAEARAMVTITKRAHPEW